MQIENLQQLSPPEMEVKIIQSTVIQLNPLTIQSGRIANCSMECFIQPQVGDTVICSVSQNDTYILQVIHRQLNVDNIVLNFAKGIEIQSPKIRMVSETHEILTHQFTIHANILKRFVDRLEESIQNVHSIIDSIFLQAKKSFRRIEDTDNTRAGHLLLESNTIAQLHGEVTLVSGEKLVQLQGQQIHMG
jgi:Protein of unknown function (DUF3540)